MRVPLLLLCLTSCASLVRAQEQENKLVDRLLRPDMTLANPAQNKTFTGTGTTPVDKKFVAKSFYSGGEQTSKSFSGERNFSAKQFETKNFTRAEQAANAKANAGIASPAAEFPTRKSSFIRTAPEAGKVASTRAYAGSRPFLAKGTRQKMLSQEDKPLTIDEVRALLNKNK